MSDDFKLGVLSDSDRERHDARMAQLSWMKPGVRVEVVSRPFRLTAQQKKDKKEAALKAGHKRPFFPSTLTKLALWRYPDSTGPIMSSQWNKFKDDPEWKRQYDFLRLQALSIGHRALVVSVLPAVECPHFGTRPWVLLLRERDASSGWCCAIDGLKQVP